MKIERLKELAGIQLDEAGIPPLHKQMSILSRICDEKRLPDAKEFIRTAWLKYQAEESKK